MAEAAVAEPAVAERLRALVSPWGGLVGSTHLLPNPAGDPQFPVSVATLGDLTRVLPEVRRSTDGVSTAGTIDGAGGSVDRAEATWLSIAEALERYSSCVYSQDQLIWATARELGDEALNLDRVPRVSAAEASDPACWVVPPDPDAPMRWVLALSLMTGRRVWIPATLVYLHIPYMSLGERFTAPISTGCAAHTDVATALTKALCEVIERDAIALTWLQRLPLPRLRLDDVDDDLAQYLSTARNDRVETHLFDATTDVGVPTVYSVEVTPNHPRVRTVVMCATEVDAAGAVRKVLREAASGRIALRNRGDRTTNPAECVTVYDGALYMSDPERLPAFDFLLKTPNERRLSELRQPVPQSSQGQLEWVLAKLKNAGAEAFAVDLTCDEADETGMTVVRTVVPELMPLSFVRRAQYRATPRLYSAPRRMGHRALPEAELNPWPQPFA